MARSVESITHRGPDNQSFKFYSQTGMGHCRLSIIDLSNAANQPFSEPTGRYHIVFNGEIYNYKEIRNTLQKEGVEFQTQSDTEVLLKLLIKKGEKGIEDINGFFAFAFYDQKEDLLLLTRDRMGIKPLLYYFDDEKLIFGSELPAILSFDFEKKPNLEALNFYFALTYIPAPLTIISGVKKLLPGELIRLEKGRFQRRKYFDLDQGEPSTESYDIARNKVNDLLRESVEKRMVSDVPLGSFLSGGLDSSIVAALAKELKPDLKTFSVGFDHPYFNEANYATEMAKHIGSDHEIFTLGRIDFENNFDRFLDAIDEPFADSSAFAVFLLSEKTRQHVKVALSGDGADELFGGYRKHLAEWNILNAGSMKKMAVKAGAGFLKGVKESRSDKMGDLNRKLQKLASGMNLTMEERYFKFCSFIQHEERQGLLKDYQDLSRKDINLPALNNLNDYLIADQQFVLPNDMLKKVDSMSMAHALEVRTPFLDHNLVNYVNTLPTEYKIDKRGGKKILRDAFTDILPNSILTRSKKGFEIPIKSWLEKEIDNQLQSEFFSRDYVEKQGLFNYEFIEKLRNSWHNPKFGDRIYMVWALIIFQAWWKRNMQ